MVDILTVNFEMLKLVVTDRTSLTNLDLFLFKLARVCQKKSNNNDDDLYFLPSNDQENQTADLSEI